MRTYLLAIAVFLSYTFVEAVTSACDPVPSAYLTRGLLGMSWDDASDTWLLPRNFAVAGNTQTLRDDVEVPFTMPDALGLSRPVTPLEPGDVVFVDGAPYTVDEAIDETPPTAPTILSAEYVTPREGVDCGPTRCVAPDHLGLAFVPADDDETPSARMTYAIYVGPDADTLSETPDVLALTTDGDASLAPLFGLVHEGDRYVAIAAIDQAGNVGPKSVAVRFDR